MCSKYWKHLEGKHRDNLGPESKSQWGQILIKFKLKRDRKLKYLSHLKN